MAGQTGSDSNHAITLKSKGSVVKVKSMTYDLRA